MSEVDKDKRASQLEDYLRILIRRSETRNSLSLIEFLDMNSFCPEIIFNVPRLLVRRDYSRSKVSVNKCLFIPDYNLYVVALWDKSRSSSRYEIYSFR